MIDYRFTDTVAPGQAVDFLRGPRLWVPASSYSDYADWLERAHADLAAGRKRLIGCECSGRLGAVVLYQPHREHAGLLEIKNLSVRPELAGRLIGSFLLRQAEREAARRLGCRAAVCDSKVDNLPVERLLLHAGWRPVQVIDLYRLGDARDTVWFKPFQPAVSTS